MAKYLAKILLLIVEDEMMLAQMYAEKFQKEGFEVDIAHNGREGLAKMRQEHPSLVLMDLLMPDTDGLQALHKAKTDEQTKDIPILVLTNMTDTKSAKEAVEGGAVDYIVKSETTPGDVVHRVKEILKLPPSGNELE
jgi:DNA-binding response OmpR family regulator